MKRMQTTREDLLGAPFHASPGVARLFLRHLRALRLHTFAAATLAQHDHSRDIAGVAGVAKPTAGGTGVSQWQQRRHTLKKVTDREKG